MTKASETFGSKLLNTVMEAMFSEEMTELEALVERMERLYPPGMEKPRTPVSGLPPAWQEWATVQTGSLTPTEIKPHRGGYMIPSQHAGMLVSTIAGQPYCIQAQYQQMSPRDRYEWLRQSNAGLDMRGLTAAGTSIVGGIFGGLFG